MSKGTHYQPSHHSNHQRTLEQSQFALPPIALPTTTLLRPNQIQCRICLQNDVSLENQMVTPCKCMGTVRFVHDLCLRRWIQRQIGAASKAEVQRLKAEGVECQLCKGKIALSFSSKYKCYSWTRFNQAYAQNRPLFFLFIFFFCLNFASISFLIYNTSKNPLPRQTFVLFILIIVGFVFLVFTDVLICYYFAHKYVFEKVTLLQGYSIKKVVDRRFSRNKVANEEELIV